MYKLTQAHISNRGGLMDDRQAKQGNANAQRLYRQREERLKLISRLVRTEKIDSQLELRERLEECGYPVAQTTLSRDIGEMGLVKVYGGYYAFPRDAVLMDVTRRYVRNAELIQHNAVIRTTPAAAPLVAETIDSVDFRGYVGSTLGNDTVNVICRSADSAAEIVSFIRNYIEDEPIHEREPYA